MSDTLKWAMGVIHNRAYGGTKGFELDEVFPTLEKEIQNLKQENELLKKEVMRLVQSMAGLDLTKKNEE